MKRYSKLVLPVLTVLLSCCWTLPAFADGNQLLEDCQESIHLADGGKVRSYLEAGRCNGIIQGTIDALELAQEFYSDQAKMKLPPVLCFPAQPVPRIQGIRIVVKYLKDHPGDLHLNDSTLVTVALIGAFPPCE
jgi:hypothetical protein